MKEVMKQCHSFKEAILKLNISESPNKYYGLWKKVCVEKKVQEDDNKIKWAEESENLNSWQQVIYNDIINNNDNKSNKVFFIINTTKNIGPATIKRKYDEISLDIQEKELQISQEQKASVILQSKELIDALLKESINRRQIGHASCLMKNIYLRARMRQPKNKYLSQTTKKITTYDRIIYDLNDISSSQETWLRFSTFLDNLIQETSTPLILFHTKHFPYEDIPEDIAPIVYEITNMYSDGILNDITNEPAFRCLQPLEIKKKSKIRRIVFNKYRRQQTNKTEEAVVPSPDLPQTPMKTILTCHAKYQKQQTNKTEQAEPSPDLDQTPMETILTCDNKYRKQQSNETEKAESSPDLSQTPMEAILSCIEQIPTPLSLPPLTVAPSSYARHPISSTRSKRR